MLVTVIAALFDDGRKQQVKVQHQDGRQEVLWMDSSAAGVIPGRQILIEELPVSWATSVIPAR